MRKTAFLLMASLAAASSAAAQAVCPAGSRLSGNTCVKDRTAAWTAPARPPAPPAAPEAPAKAEALSCEAFNLRLRAFHASRSGDYAGEVRRQRSLEDSLRDEADNAHRLEASLTRQARRARDRSTRMLLLRQARAAGEAARAAEGRIEAAEKEREEAERTLKARYKAEAVALLAQRPAGCAVKGPGK